MTIREEILESIKAEVVTDLQETIEDAGENYREDYTLKINKVKEADNLSTVADVCQSAAWDLPTFIFLVLKCAGFLGKDIGDWTWPGGWDT